ncbi:MAG: bifunctional phosphopantothenoylcysteine decarboxylase/phosphopantothenate--cysteine ligase CoaBC [Desulfovibrio sp.]|jgi:phosphopantothenoylcysteine decarboxylase/phosphopantothenate--cysteine ligase|nr:bifunctional phosphopantothenoylcysteine decarboxylase/phosphopantothenate--cysteine ligase CoaBC [Desulfovibrio sp.]
MPDRYFFSALQGRKLHLGVCGSVAAYKAVELMRALQKCGVAVSVTLTEAGARFIPPLAFESLGAEAVYTHMFSREGNSTFDHLLPGHIADAFMIAPATAATLARLATGMADELLAAQVLAFAGPLVLAPAMNPRMWSNAVTQNNIHMLEQRGASIVPPVSGKVACGDSGQGKLAALYDLIVAAAKALLPQDMLGKSILLTLGPTREQWDAVRVWTNLSTGLMGACLAHAAYLRGASVYALAGPGVPVLPAGVSRYDVISAHEMFEKALELWPKADFGIFTAAVADFYPEPFGAAKFKKDSDGAELHIRFLPNPDILARLAAEAHPGQRILAFAAETDNLAWRSREKMLRKKAHMIAGNLICAPDSGFALSTNRMFVCDKTGREEEWPTLPKADVAWRLLDWLLTL